MLLPYMDRLDQERQTVFQKLKAFSGEFVLAGGTAIMLQLGYRLSYDFDCFCEKSLTKKLLYQVRTVFGSDINTQLKSSDMLWVKTKENIDLNFVFHPYRPIRPVVKNSSIPLFHLDDLVANKAYTIGRRGAWRDYVDLFFFIKYEHYSLEKIAKLSKEKFFGEFNERLFLDQLTYFSDIKIVPTIFLKESYTDNQIKALFIDQVKKRIKTILPSK